MAIPRALEPILQPKRKGPTPHFPTKPPVVERALQLWAAALRALLDAGKSEEGVPNETITLVQRLHTLLVGDEEAADAVMAAVALLPYEQLQTLQVLYPATCVLLVILLQEVSLI